MFGFPDSVEALLFLLWVMITLAFVMITLMFISGLVVFVMITLMFISGCGGGLVVFIMMTHDVYNYDDVVTISNKVTLPNIKL